MARLRTIVLVCALSVCGGALTDAAAATIGELVAAAERAAGAANLAVANPEAAERVVQAAKTLRQAGVLDDEFVEFFERFKERDAVGLAHRRQWLYTTEIKFAIDTIKTLNNAVLSPPPPDLDQLVGDLQELQQKYLLEFDLKTLRLLERKYGPGSAKLNGLEVLAAYGLQRFGPFGVDPSSSRPGPLEAVLAYAPSYITRSNDKMQLTGVAEIGLRHYFFGEAWGTGTGKWAWVRPRYSSYGLAWAGRSDDPLTPPWQGSSRYGAFFGWGEIKVAWLGGDDRRLLVTQQIQLIPWVF
jgi:hypothetical protein